MEKTKLIKILSVVSADPNVLRNFNMPNINITTLGGTVFWEDLVQLNGWRIQQNSITHHIRILDPDDIRRAWGGMAAMERMFDRLLC